MSKSIEYQVGDGVAQVTLADPDTMNAMSDVTFGDLLEAVQTANNDPDVRVVLVAARGPHFSAGGDLNWEGELSEAASRRLMRMNAHLSFELRHGPWPILGAVRGWCLGGGNELQLHFDLTVASETARFGWPETRWGLLPFFNTPQLLPLVVGERVAREMLMLGRIYDAPQALQLGLVNAVVPDAELEAETRQWADELVVRSPEALSLVKMALNGQSDMLRIATNHQSAIVPKHIQSGTYKEEVAAFFTTPRDVRRPRPAPPRLRSTT